MTLSIDHIQHRVSAPVKIWVLAPDVIHNDEHLDYYYDFTQSIQEYTRTFESMGVLWVWQPVTLSSFSGVLDTIKNEYLDGVSFPMVLNLCDGDEVNGAPGISVVHALESHGLVYTGADAFFYDVTTSKIRMKKAFDEQTVCHAPWQPIYAVNDIQETIFETLGTPIIIKPAVSGGSMGVGVRNVVETTSELRDITETLLAGYRGWNLAIDGLVAEQFITGREFTVFLTGSHQHQENILIYTPVERVFHPSLSEKERFLSFDRLWEIYESESAMPEQQHFYEYALPDEELIEPLKKISMDAFMATRGTGYARVDIRQDARSGKLYVLEINAQCGISDDADYTSIGAILSFSKKSFPQLVVELLQDAYRRFLDKAITPFHS
jgi:D-alanine-D-alanine ligase